MNRNWTQKFNRIGNNPDRGRPGEKMKIDIEKTLHGEELDPRSFLVVECAASSEQKVFVELRNRETEGETTL